jgi:tetratricopeptide (TPR) repeat protein
MTTMAAEHHARDLARAIQLRTEGQHEEARQILRELLAAAPDDALLHYHMAWVHDAMGQEGAAVPYYERAVQLGLAGDNLRGALLGLGSTLRALGNYPRAVEVLQQGRDTFPDDRSFAVFLAMALYNTGAHGGAMELLLRALAETTSDLHIHRYQRAILFYADKLDQTWT